MGMMEILLDTHVLIWWLFDDSRLCSIARTHISHPQNKIYVSSASAWEIATKYRIGKMPEAEELLKDYHRYLRRRGYFQCGDYS
jgi:PIN domain nuclease of toxin-antitoxin system